MRRTTLLTGAILLALWLPNTAFAQADSDDQALPTDDDAPPVELVTRPPDLFVRVLQPADEAIDVPAATTTVSIGGQTLPGALASIDGILVPVDDQGMFNSDVTLDLGVNEIDVVASTADGAVADTTVIVIRGDDA